MKKILLIEDDKLLNHTLKFNLEMEGYHVTSGTSVKEAMLLLSQKYDLIILDINLPDGSGYDICSDIKEYYKDTAIIFLTANDLEVDILKGYSLGASDYVTKPFSIGVFLKKVSAILVMLSPNLENIYIDKNLTINFSSFTSSFYKVSVLFTPMEYKVLSVFIKYDNQVLTRTQLLEKLWDVENNFVDEHALTATISRIRKKINGNHIYIKTIYGVGYVWIGDHNE